nr:preprotein translocase subunit YajC [uncultured Solibaculum sp.]
MFETQLLETTAATGNNTMGMVLNFGLIAILLVLMYFVMIRPQRKRQKEEQRMRDELEVGDEIVTIGGIMGKVLSIREDSILIETGADRDKIRIMKWAIQANNSRMPVDTKANDKKKSEEKKSDEKLDKKDDQKK